MPWIELDGDIPSGRSAAAVASQDIGNTTDGDAAASRMFQCTPTSFARCLSSSTQASRDASHVLSNLVVHASVTNDEGGAARPAH